MFLQDLLLPSPIQRSFLQMQEDIVKGCKAKCVGRANESKYQNLGPFFSQGENGPDECFLSSLREAVHTHTFEQNATKQAGPPTHHPTRRNSQRSNAQQGERGENHAIAEQTNKEDNTRSRRSTSRQQRRQTTRTDRDQSKKRNRGKGRRSLSRGLRKHRKATPTKQPTWWEPKGGGTTYEGKLGHEFLENCCLCSLCWIFAGGPPREENACHHCQTEGPTALGFWNTQDQLFITC